MAEKLPNPFESKKGPDTEDYIGFSASSTPREDKFQPRRGKQNRQDNWRRFGAFEQQRQQRGGGGGGMLPMQGGYSPQTSTPNWSQQGGWNNGSPYRGRGSGGFIPRGRGGGNFTPRGRGGGFTPRGGRDGGFTPRGNFTPRGGRGGHQDNSNRSYFHPSMLEDPWAQLTNKNNSANQSLSDSLKPQLGDSMMINPAPDVPDSLEDTNDLSKYSYNSDKPDAIGMHSENNLDDDGEVPEEEETESFQRPNLSDSMIPLVGDSILEREDAEDDDDVE